MYGLEGLLKDLRLLWRITGSLSYTERPYSFRRLLTPTRIAMRYRSGLRNWVTLLKELNVNLEELAHQESTLIDDGWNADSLLVLFTDDYRCEEIRLSPGCRCQCCSLPLEDPRNASEPLWGQWKKRIKKRLDPNGPFNEEELEIQARWQRYVRLVYEKHMCYHCWEEHERSRDNA